MKADVQYNDFVGTAAADISDHSDLNDLLSSKGVDTVRYDSIGAKFYSSYADGFSASIICIDKQKTTAENPYVVSIILEEISKNEFFDLFKRFEVVITDRFQDSEIKEELSFNNGGDK